MILQLFAHAHCQSDSPIKTIDEIKITQTDENIFFGISAKSFLHHQVRSYSRKSKDGW